jgi:hypothetical protein
MSRSNVTPTGYWLPAASISALRYGGRSVRPLSDRDFPGGLVAMLTRARAVPHGPNPEGRTNASRVLPCLTLAM